MKTIRQWLKEKLDDKDFKLAMMYTPKENLDIYKDSFGDSLISAFMWKHTFEGIKYWEDIYNNSGSLKPSKAFIPQSMKLDTVKMAEFPKPEGYVKEETTSDKIVQSVINDLNERSKVGIKKYGTTLDREDLNESEWIQHLYEELLDAALYSKRIITDRKKELIDFLIYLNEKGLINNYDFVYEEEARKYLKSNKK